MSTTISGQMTTRPNPTSVRLDPKIKKALDKAAADDSRSLNNMIEKILTDWLRERGYLPKS